MRNPRMTRLGQGVGRLGQGVGRLGQGVGSFRQSSAVSRLSNSIVHRRYGGGGVSGYYVVGRLE